MTNKEDGIHKVNQEFSRYDQVKKDQVYHLSEQGDSELFDTEFEIKTCDLADVFSSDPERIDHFSQQLGTALKEIGFAILINHGFDDEIYEQAEQKIAEFFENTSLEQRMKYLAKRQGSVNQGYFPIKETTIIHPDLVEGWVFCRRAFNLDNSGSFIEADYWPLQGYESFFRQIVINHETLILPLMQSMLRYLNVDPHLYDDKLSKTNFGFRLNYYPALEGDLNQKNNRMLGHEDVDLFTILPAQNVDGLQVLNRKNMKWIHLNPPKNSIILNTGDYMQRISNNIFPSTTHRVSRPQKEQDLSKPRISLPMAIYVWEDEILEVLPNTGEPQYEPIRAETFHTRITSKYYGDDYSDE